MCAYRGHPTGIHCLGTVAGVSSRLRRQLLAMRRTIEVLHAFFQECLGGPGRRPRCRIDYRPVARETPPKQRTRFHRSSDGMGGDSARWPYPLSPAPTPRLRGEVSIPARSRIKGQESRFSAGFRFRACAQGIVRRNSQPVAAYFPRLVPKTGHVPFRAGVAVSLASE